MFSSSQWLPFKEEVFLLTYDFDLSLQILSIVFCLKYTDKQEPVKTNCESEQLWDCEVMGFNAGGLDHPVSEKWERGILI